MQKTIYIIALLSLSFKAFSMDSELFYEKLSLEKVVLNTLHNEKIRDLDSDDHDYQNNSSLWEKIQEKLKSSTIDENSF